MGEAYRRERGTMATRTTFEVNFCSWCGYTMEQFEHKRTTCTNCTMLHARREEARLQRWREVMSWWTNSAMGRADKERRAQ